MQRIVVYLQRRPELTRAAFHEWWLGSHRELAAQLPGLRRYVISLAVGAEDGPFDGMAELWFDDRTAVEVAYASEAARLARTDSDAQVMRREWLYLTEHMIVDNPSPPRIKFAAGLKRRQDMSREAFGRWWLERHVPYVRKFPDVRQYRVSLVEEGPEAVVDGIAEVWFDDLETLARVTSSDVVKEAQQHSVAHTSTRVRLFLEEHSII